MSIKSWIRKLVSEDIPKVIPEDRGLPEVAVTPPMPQPVKAKKPRKPRAKKEPSPPPLYAAPQPSENLEKLAATAKGEPWVNVTAFELDIDNLSSGSFNLDWNEIFVAKLIRAGYKGKSDIDIVDQWFTQICRNIIEENFEQMMADPDKRHNS